MAATSEMVTCGPCNPPCTGVMVALIIRWRPLGCGVPFYERGTNSMADQKRHYDLVIMGTGSAASAVAFRCRAAGWRVAVIDARPFGGTCALRGCHPKKMLVSAAGVIAATGRVGGKGVGTTSGGLAWRQRVRF